MPALRSLRGTRRPGLGDAGERPAEYGDAFLHWRAEVRRAQAHDVPHGGNPARALTRIGDPAAALFIESPGDHAVGVDRISSWGSVTVSARLRVSPPPGRQGSVLARSSMTMAAWAAARATPPYVMLPAHSCGHVDDVVQDRVLHPARRARMIRGPGVPGVRPRAGRPWRPARRRVHHRHRRRVVRGWQGRRDLSGGHPFTARPAAQVPHRPRATRARSGAPVIPVGLVGTGQMRLLRVVHPCARPSARCCASKAATIRPQMAPTGDNRHGGR